MNDNQEKFELNDADALKIDQLIEARAAGEKVDADCVGAAGVLGVLNHYPESPLPNDLVAKTLARVEVLRDHNAMGEDIEGQGNRFRLFNWQLRDIAGIAAVLLVGASLMIPVLNEYSRNQRRYSDIASLNEAGKGFASYAMDHKMQLPRQAGLGERWDMVGKDPKQSNSANLFKLVKDGYTKLTTLNSADNASAPMTLEADAQDWNNYDQVSYSYLNQFGKKPINLATVKKELVVLANKNPYFYQKDGKLKFKMTEDQVQFYGDKGQLMLTFRGDAKWRKNPKLKNGDHIYLINRKDGLLKAYNGTEVPDSTSDHHLIP